MKKTWSKGIPIAELKAQYYVDDLCGKFDQLTVKINTKKKEQKILIIFENSVYAYRDTDESFRNKTLSDLKKKYGSAFYINWSLFRVQNSQYFAWLSEQ